MSSRKKIMVWVLLLTVVLCFAGIPDAKAAEGKRKIQVMSSIFGGLLYQYIFAFSKMVEKYSDNMELVLVESAGTGAGIMKVYSDPVNIMTGGTVVAVSYANLGQRPFDKPYPDMRIIGNYARNIQTLITLNPEIKTVNDLVGKRLGLGPQPTVLGKTVRSIIHHGYDGIDKKMKIFFMKWPQLKDGLLDGGLDAMVLGVSMRAGGAWVPVPVYQEIVMARKNVYFIPLSEEAVKKASAADKVLYPSRVIRADGIAKGQPQKDTATFSDDLGLYAHKDFDPELVYELTKILYEHCGEMREVTAVAKATSVEVAADIVFPDSMIHPGALKYYKEKGLR